jgi:hypothetical protein
MLLEESSPGVVDRIVPVVNLEDGADEHRAGWPGRAPCLGFHAGRSPGSRSTARRWVAIIGRSARARRMSWRIIGRMS